MLKGKVFHTTNAQTMQKNQEQHGGGQWHKIQREMGITWGRGDDEHQKDILSYEPKISKMKYIGLLW